MIPIWMSAYTSCYIQLYGEGKVDKHRWACQKNRNILSLAVTCNNMLFNIHHSILWLILSLRRHTSKQMQLLSIIIFFRGSQNWNQEKKIVSGAKQGPVPFLLHETSAFHSEMRQLFEKIITGYSGGNKYVYIMNRLIIGTSAMIAQWETWYLMADHIALHLFIIAWSPSLTSLSSLYQPYAWWWITFTCPPTVQWSGSCALGDLISWGVWYWDNAGQNRSDLSKQQIFTGVCWIAT